jgi:hypothetical protein
MSERTCGPVGFASGGRSEFPMRFPLLPSDVFADRVQVVLKLFRVGAANPADLVHNRVVNHHFIPTIESATKTVIAAGPATLISWTSSYSETGVLGEPELATKEKGERAYKEAVKQLCRFVDYFRDRPIDRRHAEQTQRTMPIPWGQREAM